MAVCTTWSRSSSSSRLDRSPVARNASRLAAGGCTCGCVRPAAGSAAAIPRPTATPAATPARITIPSPARWNPARTGAGATSIRSASSSTPATEDEEVLHGRDPNCRGLAAQPSRAPLDAWEPTKTTLHLWVQIVGKVKLATTAPRNHWWNVPLYLMCAPDDPPLHHAQASFQIDFDFVDHRLLVRTNRGERRLFPVTREAYSHEVISFGFWSGDDTPRPGRLLLYLFRRPA